MDTQTPTRHRPPPSPLLPNTPSLPPTPPGRAGRPAAPPPAPGRTPDPPLLHGVHGVHGISPRNTDRCQAAAYRDGGKNAGPGIESMSRQPAPPGVLAGRPGRAAASSIRV